MMDRAYRGFIAGTIAGVVMNIFNLVCYYLLHWTSIRFVDWTSIIVLGSRPGNNLEFYCILIDQLVWDGCLGILFCCLIPRINSRGIIFKGIIYAYVISFLFRSVATLFQIPFLSDRIPLLASVTNHIEIFIWGAITAYLLKKLDEAMAESD